MANPVLVEIKRSGITQSFHRGAAVFLGSAFNQQFGSAYWFPHHCSHLLLGCGSQSLTQSCPSLSGCYRSVASKLSRHDSKLHMHR